MAEQLAAYQTIIFLHIGASGGSTLHPVLDRTYRSGGAFTLDWRKPVSAFADLPWSEREKIKLLKGHLTYGIHEQVRQPATYFTFLRDPVQRIISHYSFVLRSPLHPLHQTVSDGVSIQDYVQSGLTVEVDNWQVRALSGGVDYHFGTVDEALFEKAKANLAFHFSVVGLTERYDESLILLQRAFGWPPLYYVRQNTGVNRPTDLPARVLTQIRERNSWDIALYREMKAGFETTISGRPFERELFAVSTQKSCIPANR